MVLNSAGRRLVLPQAILPFLIGEPEAKRLVCEWLRGSARSHRRCRAGPGAVAGYAGLYVPFWTFDSSHPHHLFGRRGDVWYEPRYVTRTVNGRQVTEAGGGAAHSADSGELSRSRGTPTMCWVLSGETLPRHLVEPLEPWDLAGFKPYGADYLAGFEERALPSAGGPRPNGSAQTIHARGDPPATCAVTSAATSSRST